MIDDTTDDAPLKRKPGRPRKIPLPPAQTTTVQAPAFTVAPPVTLDAITADTDRFHCRPYSCILMASACIRRQDMLAKPRNERTGDYADCEGCKDGATVRKRLQMAPAEPSAGRAKHGPSPALTGAMAPKNHRRNLPPVKAEPTPEMPKPGPMLLPKSATWQRSEPSLPPPLGEIPDLPPPVELPPPPVTRRRPDAVIFEEPADVTPEHVAGINAMLAEGITPVLVSGAGTVRLASTPQAPDDLTRFTAQASPDGPPVRARRVGTAGWSGKGQPRAEPVVVTEAQTRLTHIAEVYEDLEHRTTGLLEAIRSTLTKLKSDR